MMRRAGVIALGSMLLASSLGAQQLDRSKVPVAPPAPPFRFPATNVTTLPNGLRVMVVENHALPIVAVRAVVDVDSLADPAGKEGLFVLDRAMMREGTTTMTPEQQAAIVAELGAPVTPERFTNLSSNLERALGLMADMLMNPAFSQDALERQKSVLIAAQQRQLQTASTQVRRIFFSHLLGAEHPVTRTVVTPQASMTSLTRQDVEAFHRAFIAPNHTTLILAGDVRPAAAHALAAKLFSGWKRGAGVVPAPPAVPAAAATTIYLLDRPAVQQAIVFAGVVAPSLNTPDRAALDVMAPVLGAAPGSRLQQNLRERHSYMYSATPATVFWLQPPLPGLIFGAAPINTAKADSALIEWMAEMRGIRERAPTDAEMTMARGVVTGSLGTQIETNDRVADRIAGMVKNGLPANFDDGYVARVAKVTPADVLAAAKRHVDPDHMVIVIAGDRKTLEPKLRAAKIAPVVVVDDNGAPIP